MNYYFTASAFIVATLSALRVDTNASTLYVNRSRVGTRPGKTNSPECRIALPYMLAPRIADALEHDKRLAAVLQDLANKVERPFPFHQVNRVADQLERALAEHFL